MNRLLSGAAAIVLILPAGLLLYGVLEHCWYLYCQTKQAYSFGINFEFGQSVIGDPWSDTIIVFSSGIAFACGVAVILLKKRKVQNWTIGAAMLALNGILLVRMFSK